MDPINETVIFPDRPLFLTHRKRPGNPGTIDLSPANLNGFMADPSSSETTSSAFRVQSQPATMEGTGSLARYRKIKFIDNNVAEITKRRSARPRQLKSKRLRTRPESSKIGSSSVPEKPDSGSTSPTDETVPSTEEGIEVVENVPRNAAPATLALGAFPVPPVLLGATPRSELSMFTDGLAGSTKALMPQLIFYYVTTLSTAVYPFSSSFIFNPMTSHWFPLAITDELMFHTALFACTAHMVQLGKGCSQENSELLHRIVRRLSNRIVQARDNGHYSDTTIAAVSCLAMTEAALGNWDKWKVHIDGMKRMITLKGGMKTIAEPLHLKIYRADIEGAVESGMPPVLDPPTHLQQPIGFSNRHGQMRDPLSYATKRPVYSPVKLEPIVAHVLNEIVELSAGLEQTMKDRKATIHPWHFDGRIVNLQHQLLQVPFEGWSTINNACRYASLIYLKSFLRESNLRWTSVRLADRLQAATQNLMPVGYNVPMLCWIAFMGLFGTLPGTEQWKWFATTLVQWYHSRKGHPPANYEAVKQELVQFAWIPAVHDETAQQLWQIVEEAVISGMDMKPLKYASDVFFVLG